MSIQDDVNELKGASKFMSLVLRHRPGLIGLQLREGGWASVADLLEGMNRRGHSLTRDDLAFVVEHNDKARYSFDETGDLIRANQGHSVEVDLQLTAIAPPDVLYHGTYENALGAVLREGLKKMKRHHVHLSVTRETAVAVGARRGRPIVLVIASRAMAEEGHLFYRSENGVWLTETVPPRFLTVYDNEN